MNSSTTAPSRKHRPGIGAVLTGFAFGVAGLVFGLHKLAIVVLKYIVVPDPSLAFQEVSDSLPVPKKLDWNVPLIQSLVALRDMRGSALIALAILLLALVCIAFVAIVLHDSEGQREAGLTPTPVGPVEKMEVQGQPAADPPPEESSLLPTESDRESGVQPEDPSVLEVRNPPVAKAGAGAQPATVGRPQAPILRLVLLYAVCIAPLVLFGSATVSDIVLRYYRTLGTFNQDYFERIAVPSVGFSVALWAMVGLGLNALCVKGRSASARGMVAAGAVALLGIAVWCRLTIPSRTNVPQRDWSPAVLTTIPPQSPFGVPDGADAAELFSKTANVPMGERPEQPGRSLVILLPNRAWNVWLEGITEDGLAASAESAAASRRFLERRHYETAFSWEATKQIFGESTVHFDATAAIDACLTDMERCPHLAQCGPTTRTMLFTCSASPANLALLDRWADERRFAHPTRDSRRLMGQLYQRFGQRDKALAWYRRADMPKSFLKHIETSRPIFHAGRILGRLALNGKPLSGVQVGVIPRRLNGLPPDLEPEVMSSPGDLIAGRPQQRFPRFHPIPYSLRWISASCVTDAAGGFDLKDLTQGEYTLVFTLPPSIQLTPRHDSRLTITNPPPTLNFHYTSQTLDIGTIGLAIR